MHIEQKSFYADLYSKSSHRDPAPMPPLPAALSRGPVIGEAPPRHRSAPEATSRENRRESRGETLPVPVERPEQSAAPEPAGPRISSTLTEIIGAIDTRYMSPRQMANLSLDLYVSGAVNFEDYAELAFQPELHPDFDLTIGALTGEKAAPDRPRDFVRLWQDKAQFLRRHNNQRHDLIKQSDRIASLLRQIGGPSKRLI